MKINNITAATNEIIAGYFALDLFFKSGIQFFFLESELQFMESELQFIYYYVGLKDLLAIIIITTIITAAIIPPTPKVVVLAADDEIASASDVVV